MSRKGDEHFDWLRGKDADNYREPAQRREPDAMPDLWQTEPGDIPETPPIRNLTREQFKEIAMGQAANWQAQANAITEEESCDERRMIPAKTCYESKVGIWRLVIRLFESVKR